MPEFHAEPYLHLAGLSHKSALIAWGAFYFRVRSRGRWKLVDDQDLKYVHPPRRESIGARSEPYGPAHVRVYDRSGGLVATAFTEVTNWCWVTGLKPDTEYRYDVVVKGESWGQDERWDWNTDAEQGLAQTGGRYRNIFRTHPDPAQPSNAPFTFAVIGDFGTGIRRPSTPERRQREVAAALVRAVDESGARLVLTTGDNIYAGRRLFGLPIGSQGDEDDDWFFTFFQPYRYLLNRIPVYPSIGNHDSGESEDRDDRDQVMDNFFLMERAAGDEAAGRASIGPGLFYRFRYGADVEFLCIDTSKEDFFGRQRLFEYPKHWEFIEQSLPAAPADGVRWRIPFCHHPRYCAGPRHHNADRMAILDPLFARAGVRVMFSGHEHNFQHARVAGVDYFVTGAGSKVRLSPPDGFADAHTLSWASAAHFLLVTIDGDTMRVRPIGEVADGQVREIDRRDPQGRAVTDPILITRPSGG
jgi:tartrate-resistant acid phosphatase type 5